MCDFIKDCISVIVPVYNVEKYLSRCIESIINQSYQNIEIILINDGSTDNSSIICDEYAKKDTRIKVIHKKNGGVSSARNVGLKNARGEFITFVDSDDYIKLTCFEKMVNGIKNNDVDMVVVGWEYGDGTIGWADKNIDIDCQKVYTQDEISKSYLFLTVWGHLFRRMDLNGMFFNEKIFYGEDTLFTFQSFYKKKSSKLLVIGESLYIYINNRIDSAMNIPFNEKHMSFLAAYDSVITIVKPYKKILKNVKVRKKDEYFIMYLRLLKSGHKNHRKYYFFLKCGLIKLRLQGYKPKNKKENFIEILYIYFYSIFKYYLKLRNMEGMHDK